MQCQQAESEVSGFVLQYQCLRLIMSFSKFMAV